MQSTDLISLLVIALGNAQVSGTRHPPIDSVEELLKLDISGKKEKYAAVRFLTKDSPEGKPLADWLLSLEGLKQLRLIKGQLQAPEGMTPAMIAAMSGGSPMMLLGRLRRSLRGLPTDDDHAAAGGPQGGRPAGVPDELLQGGADPRGTRQALREHPAHGQRETPGRPCCATCPNSCRRR
jgi:hypothetical protein